MCIRNVWATILKCRCYCFTENLAQCIKYLVFDGYLPNEDIEYICYDQLDSYYSDKPNDSTLRTTKHFVKEMAQVRKALHLKKDNFYLFGQSLGGMLAMEYALKYQDNLKGLIISNMMASAPEYTKYAIEVRATNEC